MAPHTLVYLVLVLWALAIASAEIIDDNDPRVLYTPSAVLHPSDCTGNLTNSECRGHWWLENHSDDHNQTIHTTFGPDTTLTFNFQGSSISMFGVTLQNGAFATVSVDGGNVTTVHFAGSSQAHAGVQLFTLDGLDPRVTHTFTLRYDDNSFGHSGNRRLLAIDYWAVETDAAHTNSTGGSAPIVTPARPGSSASAAPSASSAVRSSNKTRVLGIAFGVAIGCIVALTAVALVAYRMLRRRRQVAPSTAARAALAVSAPAAPAGVRPPNARWSLAAARVVPTQQYPFVGGSNTGSSEPDRERERQAARASVTYPSTGSRSSVTPPPPRGTPAGRPLRRAPTQHVFTIANPDPSRVSIEGR